MNFECPICCDLGDATGSETNGLCMVQSCGHVFHVKCIKQWQDMGNRNCPTCRLVCRRTWILYGAQVTGGGDDIRRGNEEDEPLYQAMYESLSLEYTKLEKKLAESLYESRLKDRRSDNKQLEILKLRNDIQELEAKLVELQDKLDVSEKHRNEYSKTLTLLNFD